MAALVTEEMLDVQLTTERTSKAPGTAVANRSDASVGEALERLLAASEGVVTKRIDLALLEAQQIVAQGLVSVLLLALSLVWIAGGWFAFAICVVELLLEGQSYTARVAAFGVLNAAAAVVGFLAMRRSTRLRKETH